MFPQTRCLFFLLNAHVTRLIPMNGLRATSSEWLRLLRESEQGCVHNVLMSALIGPVRGGDVRLGSGFKLECRYICTRRQAHGELKEVAPPDPDPGAWSCSQSVGVITVCFSLIDPGPTSGAALPPVADPQPCKGTHSSIIDNWLGQVRWRGNL